MVTLRGGELEPKKLKIPPLRDSFVFVGTMNPKRSVVELEQLLKGLSISMLEHGESSSGTLVQRIAPGTDLNNWESFEMPVNLSDLNM